MKRKIIMTVLLVLLLTLLMINLAAASNTAAVSWPTRPPTATLSSMSSKVEGGFIKLNIMPPQSDLWTQIQWRDDKGIWHDVDGWGGTPIENHVVHWYVGPEHLGKGPFRWQILTQERTLLANTELFSLPEKAGQILTLNIDIDVAASSTE